MGAHEGHSHGLQLSETTAQTTRAATLSVLVALILIAVKAAAWAASGSVAVVASLADSGLDLVASLGTLFALRVAATPPDHDHRYGHGKAEAFASLMQAGLVFASAALVGREAIGRLLNPQPLREEFWAIVVMAVSIVLTGALVAYQTGVMRRTGSVAVSGDRAHYLADLGSNAAALIGVAGAAWLDLPALDAVAGLVVAAWLFAGAVGVLRQAADHLMDKELPDEDSARIHELIAADHRIKNVHQLRTRASGPFVHVQAHVELDAGMTLQAAHGVLVAAEKRVLEAFPRADILLHADPEHGAEPHGGLFAETENAAPSG